MNEGQSIPKLNSRYVPCAWCEARVTSLLVCQVVVKLDLNQIKVRSFKQTYLSHEWRSKYSQVEFTICSLRVVRSQGYLSFGLSGGCKVGSNQIKVRSFKQTYQSIPKLNSRYVLCAWCEARVTSSGLSGGCKVRSNQIKVRSFKQTYQSIPRLNSRYVPCAWCEARVPLLVCQVVVKLDLIRLKLEVSNKPI